MPPKIYKNGRCELCHRLVLELTDHHLRPKAQHKRLRKKGIRDARFLNEAIKVCQPCHSTIHANFTEKELALNFDSLKNLMEQPEIQKWVEWVKDKPDKHIRVRMAKND